MKIRLSLLHESLNVMEGVIVLLPCVWYSRKQSRIWAKCWCRAWVFAEV